MATDPVGGGILDPDGAIEYLTGWQARVDANAAAAKAMSDRMDVLRVSAADGEDLVTVTIDATGVLAGLRFTPKIARVAPEAVERAVLRALGLARTKAAVQARAVVNETMGADSIAGRHIAAQVEKRLSAQGGERGDG